MTSHSNGEKLRTVGLQIKELLKQNGFVGALCITDGVDAFSTIQKIVPWHPVEYKPNGKLNFQELKQQFDACTPEVQKRWLFALGGLSDGLEEMLTKIDEEGNWLGRGETPDDSLKRELKETILGFVAKGQQHEQPM